MRKEPHFLFEYFPIVQTYLLLQLVKAMIQINLSERLDDVDNMTRSMNATAVIVKHMLKQQVVDCRNQLISIDNSQ